MNIPQLMAVFKKFDLQTLGLLKQFAERAQNSGNVVAYVKNSLEYLEARETKIPTVIVTQTNNNPRIRG